LGVHAAIASTCDDSEGDHRVYLPSSPLSSAQRAWSNICAPRWVQRICCFFSIRQSTSWSTVDSTRAVDMRWPSWYSLPYVLDGLLYHPSSLVINEHYTDTGGFSDHVFAMCRLLGFRFAPRIRDLKEKRLYILPGMTVPPDLASLVAGTINLRVISDHWFELLRLGLSIKTGTVTASVILRKLAAYPRQNALALALRELGKLERTFFTLQWLQDPELRRRSHVASTRLSSKMHTPFQRRLLRIPECSCAMGRCADPRPRA
jgi:hypothetical protein